VILIYWLFIYWRNVDEQLLERTGYQACQQSSLAETHACELEKLKENIDAMHT
jgi:hypothetical protein